MPGGDWIHPTDALGAFTGEGLIPIDAVHRQGVPHKGVWLHVFSDDGHILLVHRSPQMATCPNTWSTIGEHHSGREDDVQCAHRAVREELPGLKDLLGTPRMQLTRLRAQPRWFLFDYPSSYSHAAAAAARVQRVDRCLISEYLVHVRANASEALLLLTAGRAKETEHEASRMAFVPLHQVARRLRRHPESFCAPELFPRALLDSYASACGNLSLIHI